MACTVIKLPGGGAAIACGPRPRCRGCGRPARYQCDYEVEGKTCDAWLCAHCRVPQGSNVDFCARHAKEARPLAAMSTLACVRPPSLARRRRRRRKGDEAGAAA
jgi:hypothetical protein